MNKNLRIHYLQHVPFEGLGSIGNWIDQHGHTLTSTRLYQNDSFPACDDFDWLCVMGGPMNVYEIERYPWLVEEKRVIDKAIANNKTIIGVCLGAQLLADVLGARIYRNEQTEIGWFPVRTTDEAENLETFRMLPRDLEVFHWHGDTFDLPDGATLISKNNVCENQAFVYNKTVIGFQYHLETTRNVAERLIENCADEMIAAPYIQAADKILGNVAGFNRINTILDSLLDSLSAQSYRVS